MPHHQSASTCWLMLMKRIYNPKSAKNYFNRNNELQNLFLFLLLFLFIMDTQQEAISPSHPVCVCMYLLSVLLILFLVSFSLQTKFTVDFRSHHSIESTLNRLPLFVSPLHRIGNLERVKIFVVSDLKSTWSKWFRWNLLYFQTCDFGFMVKIHGLCLRIYCLNYIFLSLLL